MSESKLLTETEDSKMKSYIKNERPKKMKFFKRIKKNIMKSFGKRLEMINIIITYLGYQINQLTLMSCSFIFILIINIKKKRKPKPWLDPEDSKMKSDTTNKKPNKMNIFKRMKRSVLKFFAKSKQNTKKFKWIISWTNQWRV